MKKGIIIVFSNDENKIEQHQFKNLFNQDDVKVCLVNNGSIDNTLKVLRSVKTEVNRDVIVLDIKKNNGINAAIKAGARCLFNSDDLKFILYIKSNMLTYFKDFTKQLEALHKTEKAFKNKLNIKNRRKTLEEVFSYDDFLTF